MALGLVMPASFGRKLKKLREDAGLSQEALGRAAGLSTSFVSKLEQKNHDPSWSTVQALAKALGVGFDAFADDEQESEEVAEDEVEEPATKPATKKPKRKK